jgi:sterol desaturase/sphingolipid hydroxylase (fatty acid hydroxylase superfamily)
VQDVKTFLSYTLYGFIALAVVEGLLAYLLFRRAAPPRGNRSKSARETAANLGVYLISRLWRDFVTSGVEIAALSALYVWTPFAKLPVNGWTFALALFAADYVYYWKHRSEHGVRLLWAYHSVHHSSDEYNLSTALRLPWFGATSSFFFHAPLVLFGLSPIFVVLSRQLVLLYQFWIHTEHVGSLGWFDNVFNSPSNHRVHHGSNPVYLDRNHGGILILWDKVHGTYQAELGEDPVRYGLTHPVGTQHPVKLNLAEPLAILRDVRAAESLGDAVSYVLRGPGWTPQQRGLASNVAKVAGAQSV